MGNSAQSRKDFKSTQNSLLVGFQNVQDKIILEISNSMLCKLSITSPLPSPNIHKHNNKNLVHVLICCRSKPDSLIAQLRSIYKLMQDKKDKGAISTLKMMTYIQKTSGIFQREHHQDSHQFYIWLMNSINDQLKAINKKNGLVGQTKLQEEFFSKRITRTECMLCHTVSEREEEEVDLSLVLPEPNVSLNYCVDNYSAVEKLVGSQKFKCDKCGDLQNAQKRTLIKTLPNFLSVHLRRFKYDQARKGIIKLMWLIPFPYKIKLKPNYTPPTDSRSPEQKQKQKQKEKEKERQEMPNQKQMMYRLVGVVAHIGNGGNFGHYVCYVKIGKQWYMFNDDQIQPIDDYMLEALWGYKGMTKCAYMLFYSL